MDAYSRKGRGGSLAFALLFWLLAFSLVSGTPHSRLATRYQLSEDSLSHFRHGRRDIASPSELEEARAVMSAARDDSLMYDPFTSPKRNHYTLRPSGAPSVPVNASLGLTESPSIRDAGILLAESHATELFRSNRLYKDYKIAYVAEDGSIAHKVHKAPHTKEALQKRQSSGYWMAKLGRDHPGNYPFGSDNGNYKVFRNVKDYGAKGDGRTDDTDAINKAISDGNRCGETCGGSSVKGATVYFPAGTYLVRKTIIALFHTQLVGDPNDMPVLLAAPDFEDIPGGVGVVTVNIYTGRWNDKWKGDDEWYLNVGNFFRQMRNFVIDLTEVKNEGIKGLHWQVAQATSLQNIHFKMRSGSSQTGLFIENGSGGTIDDLTFEGGGIGMECGNQQYTVKNLIFEGCTTAINMLWDWGWVWKGIKIRDSRVGINFTGKDFPGGSLTLLDSSFDNVNTGIIMDQNPVIAKEQATLILLNVNWRNTPIVADARVTGSKLSGGSNGAVDSWIIGYVHSQSGDQIPRAEFADGASGGVLGVGHDPSDSLLFTAPRSAGYFTRPRPQYEDRGSLTVTSAKGDGRTDDTAALNNDLRRAASSGTPLFLPTGSYIVTDTVFIPKGVKIVGMCWSQIVASGPKFGDIKNPHVMVRVGNKGDVGNVEISDLLFTARGPTAGLIAMEWNLKGQDIGDAGMWDSHFRIGGAAGTNLQLSNCPKQSGVKKSCIAASLLLHLTEKSSAYLDNVWVWVADHDLDHPPSRSEEQVDIYVARGVLIESQGPTWLWGTASEHCVLYQYSLSGAKNLFMGLAQTESAYFRPNPATPEPFGDVDGKFRGDPWFKNCGDKGCSPWALRITESEGVWIIGAGFYSWFLDNYDQSCIEPHECQKGIVEIDQPSSKIFFYNLFTVGSTEMISPMSGDAIMAKDNQMLLQKSPWTSCIAAWARRSGSSIVFKAQITQDMVDQFFHWVSEPTHCYGIDSCFTDNGNIDPGDDDKSSSKNGGYLCLLDAVIEEVEQRKKNSDESQNLEAWDRVFWRDMGVSGPPSCSTLGGSCPSMQGSCGGYVDPAYYWLVQVFYNLNRRSTTIADMLTLGAVTSHLRDEGEIIDKLMKSKEEPMALKKILKIVSQVMGWLGLAAPHMGGPSPASQARADTATEVFGVGGMAFDTAQEHMEEESEAEKALSLRNVIDSALGTVMVEVRTNVEKIVGDFFGTGNLDSWPSRWFKDRSITLEDGTKYALKKRHSKFLSDQSFVYLAHQDETIFSYSVVTNYTAIGIGIMALSPDKYYILKNPIHMEDCEKSDRHPTSRNIGGSCYELHRPGKGWVELGRGTINDPTGFSVPANDDIASIFKFGVDLGHGQVFDGLEVLYQGSIECQNSRDTYPTLLADENNVDIELEPLHTSGSLMETCIFNLPVLEVMPEEFMKPTISTPCIVNKSRTDIAGAGSGDKLGINVLPKYLQDVFGQEDFCRTTCAGRRCFEEETACPREVCLSVPTGSAAPLATPDVTEGL